ncbi:hypothetical protein IAD21_02952 [Abditibacteriota bacterium]|nr:hypothetical protein IAD21_02952 [Abditibacteriota bacterium]
MNAHQIQELSQLFNPIFAIVLIVCAVRALKKSALLWIVCVAISVGVAQQISKIVQHLRWVSDNFPSTHFAVALALAGAYWALNRRFIPATLVYLVVYGVLIVWRSYHTPLELAGAFYALPLGYVAGRLGTRRDKITSNN